MPSPGSLRRGLPVKRLIQTVATDGAHNKNKEEYRSRDKALEISTRGILPAPEILFMLLPFPGRK